MANQQSDIRLVPMVGMYGTCRAINAYRGWDLVGSATRSVLLGRGPVWSYGPENRPDADEFAGELASNPALTHEEELQAVGQALLRALAAADAKDARRAA